MVMQFKFEGTGSEQAQEWASTVLAGKCLIWRNFFYILDTETLEK